MAERKVHLLARRKDGSAFIACGRKDASAWNSSHDQVTCDACAGTIAFAATLSGLALGLLPSTAEQRARAVIELGRRTGGARP